MPYFKISDKKRRIQTFLIFFFIYNLFFDKNKRDMASGSEALRLDKASEARQGQTRPLGPNKASDFALFVGGSASQI